MGDVTRAREIRRRRIRRRKRQKERLRELKQLLQRGRTHSDRVKIAQEFRAKSRAAASATS